MRFAVLALCVAVPVLAAQDNEAEKLLRQVETKITQAKAIRIVGTLDVPKGPGMMKAVLTIAGDKLRLQVDGERDGKAFRAEMVSDGKMIRQIPPLSAKSRQDPAPKKLGPALSKLIARVGLAAMELPGRHKAEQDKELDADDLIRLSEFKMSEPEKVGGRQAKVITFKATPKDRKDAATVTVWIDAKTLLPLKHVIADPREEGRITATYTTFDLNPKVDPKDFELPR